MAARQYTDYDSYINEPNNTNLDHIPGDWGLPLVGHTLDFFKDPVAWTQKAYKQHGPLVKLNSFGTKGLAPLGPDLLQQVFTDPNQDFSSKAGFARLEKFFGRCVIAEDFGDHRHQRRIMQSAFKVDNLRSYTGDINAVYETALKQWESDNGEVIKVFQKIKSLLLIVAADVFFGEKARDERLNKLNQAFIDTVAATMYIAPFSFPGNATYKGFKGRRFLDNYFRPLIPSRRAGTENDMFSCFCREKDEDGNYYPEDEIISQMLFLMFAAHDTTTAAITNTFYYVSRHPEVKEKLYQECLSIGKDSVDYDDLNKLQYMQQVFNEVLRFVPSVAVLPRRTVREVEMAGYKVPAHTQLILLSSFNHFMDEYWTEPGSFDPDRFSPERAEHKKHTFQYLPFGGGAHKCIGMHFSLMEYKCFMYQFMLKFDFEAAHKKEPGLLRVPIPKPRDDMPIRIHLR